jgi:hypothetical protein
MGRNDLDVILVKGDEFEFLLHGRLPFPAILISYQS